MPKNLKQAMRSLLTHIINSPSLPEQLEILHNLALYESGEALLGEEEKEALLNAKTLSDLLKNLRSDDLREMLSSLQ